MSTDAHGVRMERARSELGVANANRFRRWSIADVVQCTGVRGRRMTYLQQVELHRLLRPVVNKPAAQRSYPEHIRLSARRPPGGMGCTPPCVQEAARRC